jgi:hypothetical protein
MMMRIVRAVLVIFFILAIATRARADTTSDARSAAQRHFTIGLELVAVRAWDAALAEFSRSRELYPTANALSNAAVCLRELGRFDEALDMYDELFTRFSSEVAPADKKLYDEDIARVTRYVGALVVRSDPAGAVVVVDGRERGVTPLARPIRVVVGTRAVRVQRTGYAPYETKVSVASGETRDVDARLVGVSRLGRVRVVERSGRALDVVIDGAVVGASPWEGTLPAGEHRVALRGAGDLGSRTTLVDVDAGVTKEIAIGAVRLPGDLRVEPTPALARVRIDGALVSTGAWGGELPSGDHVVDIDADWHEPERVRVTVSSRAPQVIRPVLTPVARMYMEMWAGPTLAANTTAHGVPNCAAGCGGAFLGLRGGHLVTPRMGIEFSSLLALLQNDSIRSITVTGFQGTSTINAYTETADVFLYGGVLSAHYRFFDDTPLTLRALAGAARGQLTVSAGQSGSYAHGFQTPTAFWAPMVGLDVRFGWRFRGGIVFDFGLSAYALPFPSTRPREGVAGIDPSVSLPATPSFDGGIGFFVPATLGAHFEL